MDKECCQVQKLKNVAPLLSALALVLALTSNTSFSAEKECPLLEAVIQSNAAQVKRLMAEGRSVDGADCPNRIAGLPLSIAIGSNNLKMVELLLDYGANPNPEKSSPLNEAANLNRPKIVEAILRRGANPNAKSKFDYTPLYLAASCGSYFIKPRPPRWEEDCVATVKVLLAGGALPNQPSFQGSTPLFYAAEEGRAKVVKELVSHGAEVNYLNNLKMSPLAAVLYSYVGHQNKLARKSAIRALLEAGADPDFKYEGSFDDYEDERVYPNTGGYTVLMFAARYGWSEVAELLLQYGARPELQRSDGATAQQIALAHGHSKTARVIAKYSGGRKISPK